MLDDRERGLLFEIERRLLAEDPGFVRSFGPAPPPAGPAPPPAGPGPTVAGHGRETDVIAALAGLTLCLVLLRGPRCLSPAEVTVLGSAAALRCRDEEQTATRRLTSRTSGVR